MAFSSIPAIYDGTTIKLLEAAPVQTPYRVLVTFISPQTSSHTTDSTEQLFVGSWSNFLSTFGTWQDDRSVDEILDDIRTARISKSDPIAL